MKKNLLVTLADKNYFEKAKQLFSAAYFNAGWQGDYMILVPSSDKDEPGLKWFRDKGILIKECAPLFTEKIIGNAPSIFTNKFYLFTPEYKKWDNIVYLDVDIIVRASLDELTKVEGFAAVSDLLKFRGQLVEPKMIGQNNQELFKQLKKKYNLRSQAFSAGVFAFNTKIIEEKTFNQLNAIIQKYKEVFQKGDQAVFNIYFYKKWQKLQPIYNIFIVGNKNKWLIKQERIQGVLLHFVSPGKPWVNKNYFYQEWEKNLEMADNIDLTNIPAGEKWSQQKIITYLIYLKYRLVVRYIDLAIDFLGFFINRTIGLIGIFLKNILPIFIGY